MELGQRAPRYSYEDKQRWYRELIAHRSVLNSRRAMTGKLPLKPGWSAAQYKEKFGVWPPNEWKHIGPAPEVSAEVAQPANCLRQGHAGEGRGMRHSGKLPPFIAMDRNQHKSAAFAQLSATAQALLVHLTYNYNTKLMNAVFLSGRDGAKKLNENRSAVAYALLELEHYGFIVKVKGAHLGVEGVGKAALYRLTARPYGNLGATRDYEKWDGTLFDPPRRRMTQADKERLARRKKQKPGSTVSHPGPTVSHKEILATPPEVEQVAQPRAIRTPAEWPNREPYLVSPSGSAAQAETKPAQPEPAPVRPDPDYPMSALRQWSKPVMTEIEYTPELRRLYCEAVPEDERPAKRDSAGDILKKYATRVIATATPTVH